MTDTILAGVMGWPVAHSRSPLLHGTWLKRYGVDGAYVKLPVAPQKLEQALRALPALGFAGVNLTVPHKEAAVRIVDHLTPQAARMRSVNMVTVLPDGSLEGASTDGYGFIGSLCQAVPDWRANAGPIAMIGAGGAARAVADALIEAGATTIRVANRTDSRAQALAADLGPRIEPWVWARRGEALAEAVLLINTTSLGMTGQEPLDLDLAALPTGVPVVDIVYSPLETKLLAAARARGNLAVDGLGMLLHQARPAFARWFGIDPAVDEALRGAVLAR